MKKLSRREFLNLGVNSLLGLSAVLGLGGLIRFLSYEMDPAPPSQYDLGPVTDFPVGSRILLLHIPAVVIHARDGWLAMSLICTHLGCTVDEKEGQYECPCHGSKYDARGLVQRGPSNTPLKKLKVETNEAGNVILYMS